MNNNQTNELRLSRMEKTNLENELLYFFTEKE